jgi:cobalt/nickel transport protein
MKRAFTVAGLLFALTLMVLVAPAGADNKWPGVDDAVVKKFAEDAGRPSREPYLNFGEGDIQLFFFLIAGAVGGFVAGYYYRDLFTPQPNRVKDTSNV